MIESLKWRIIITVTVVTMAIVWLMPNFASFARSADTWWPTKDTINYGLDIQGGLHLVLKVDVDSVLHEKTERLVKGLVTEFKDNQLAFAVPSRPNKEKFEFEIAVPEASQQQVTDYLDKQYINTLQVIDSNEIRMVVRYLDPVLIGYRKQTIDQAIEVIRNRVDDLGLTEPSITAQGENRILVQLPGIENAEQAKSLINKTAKLDFRVVNDEVAGDELMAMITTAETEGKYALGEEGLKYGPYAKRINKDLKEKLPKGTQIVFKKSENAKTMKAGKEPFLINGPTGLTGDMLDDAYVSRGQYNEPIVTFSFNVDGRRLFSKITGDNINKRLAIVLDDRIRSAPNIKSKIDSASAIIELGTQNMAQALEEGREIATVLRSGALPATLEQLEERTVGPTLGSDSIAKGKLAGIVGGILVLAFMLLYYRKLGVVANVALTFNVIFLLAILSSLGATLTLPGVAGIVLTVGMAVDANVIIFERMREEFQKGAGIKTVIRDGYGHAFSAIFDANITTAIVCFVLMYFGTGPVRGFAVTLLCGLATSMFTAIFVSRTILEVMVNKFGVKKLSF